MRIRSLLATAALATAIFAPTAASADVCYDIDAQLNGDVLVDESDCIES